MAKAIKVQYCKGCGQLESMRSTVDEVNQQIIIDVGCVCGAEDARRTVLGLHEAYYLDVEVRELRKEAQDDEDPDSGDVPQG